MCYDFQFGIFHEEEDMLFVIKLNLFSIGTIIVLTQTKLISNLDHISDIGTLGQVPTTLVESTCV